MQQFVRDGNIKKALNLGWFEGVKAFPRDFIKELDKSHQNISYGFQSVDNDMIHISFKKKLST